ncbi:MAG TPA: fluoride efflux transporter CrcB [Aridibacter sp.]|nr:fluoride efflux transporter CrcB [Aridibacter sp.]
MDTATKLIFIAAGGAFGAVARYLINISPLKDLPGAFPYPTFAINIVGSFLIGFCFIALTDRFEVGDNLRFAIMVGFLGAFTTFSTFELEIWGLFRDGRNLAVFLYIFLSLALGFVGLILGIFVARKP